MNCVTGLSLTTKCILQMLKIAQWQHREIAGGLPNEWTLGNIASRGWTFAGNKLVDRKKKIGSVKHARV